jgi:hypothetical protein
MKDVRKFKKNPKGPDFRCSDKECKFSLDKNSGEYVEGEYTTAVWLPKAKPSPTIPQNSPTIAPQGDIKTQLIVVAGNIVASEIRAGITVEKPFARVADGLKVLLTAQAEPFGKKALPHREPEPEDIGDNPGDYPEGDEAPGVPF